MLSGYFLNSLWKERVVLDPCIWVDIRISMAYVDLNPIRAAMAKTPEDSDYTSIQERITAKKSDLLKMGFNDNEIPYSLVDYCDLVDSSN